MTFARAGIATTTLPVVIVGSGAAALASQAVWIRLFTNGLGHEVAAVLAVIAGFFGGSAVGAWLMDTPISRSRFPGRWFAGLEAVIGLWHLALLNFVPEINRLAGSLTGLDAGFARQWAVGFVIPLMVLLPATVCMGATLTAMERVVSTISGRPRCLGRVYGLNTFGGVIGVAGGTFFAAPSLGFQATLVTCAAINLGCALIVWFSVRGATPVRGPVEQRQGRASRPRRLYLALFWTGFLGIGYEVLGVRVLSQVLEGTVYTYAITLSVYLFGTAAGAGVYQWRVRQPDFQRVLDWLLPGLAASVLAGVWTLSRAPDLYARLRGFVGDQPAAIAIAEGIVTLSVFLPPTLLMGAMFSHLAQAAKGPDGGVGRAVALNTMGAMAAPLGFGVLAVSAGGSKLSLLLCALGYLLLLPAGKLWKWLCGSLPVALSLGLLCGWQFLKVPPGGRVVEFREGVGDSVAVVEHFDRHRTLLVNGRFTMGGTGSAVAERRQGQIPLLLHPAPRRALFLGVGTGITLAASGLHSGLFAEGVELVPEVVAVMPWFEPENRIDAGQAQPKVHVADARRFVRSTGKRYDVIVGDLFHPARDGAGNLYTREHFAAIRERLAAGGLFCQWLPLHQLDEVTLRIIVRTFLEVFPDARAWLLRFNVDTPVLGLIAGTEPYGYSASWFAERTRDPGLAEGLRPVTLADPFQLFGGFVAGADALRRYARNAPVNTDDHLRVMFQAPRFSYRSTASPYALLLSFLREQSPQPEEILERTPAGEVFRLGLGQYFTARDLYLAGLVSESEGRPEEAIETFVKSAEISSSFTPGYARCLTIATQWAATDPAAAKALLRRLIDAQPGRPAAAELLRRISP